MQKKSNTWAIALLILLLVGAVAGMTAFNNQNVTVYNAHDHDKDGKPDHGDGAHAH